MKIISAVTNDLETDQRVFKIAKTFHDLGYEVELVGRQLKTSKPIHFFCKTKRFKLLFNKQVWFYANYNIRLFICLLINKFDVVWANDLDTLPACFLASKIKRKKIIYDSHEYFTEVPELTNTKFQRKFWLSLEKLLVPSLKTAFTVSESIAEAYKQKYKVDFKVLRNLPNKIPAKISCNKNRVPTLIYQGALNMGRGIELLIQAMQYLDNFVLWIAGGGDVEDDLKTLVRKKGLENKVVFLGRLTKDDLLDKTLSAHIGFSLEEDAGLNYRYALPNKLFDYIQAKIPVIVSNLPEMRNIVSTYKIGEVLHERTPELVANLVVKVFDNQYVDKKYTKALEIASSELCWENEQKKLLTQLNKK